MIAALTGTIASTDHNKLHLQTPFATFELFCPHAHHFVPGQTSSLHTYLHWNQEQGPTLFGFLNTLDKEVFLLIISCSGIGPKLGLSILEQLDAAQFLHLISEENIVKLSTLKNIGTKKAEQLCLSLKNKVPKLLQSNPQLATKIPMSVWRDLQDTLTSLHYSGSEIKQTTSMLKEEMKEMQPGFDLLLRKALQMLSKK